MSLNFFQSRLDALEALVTRSWSDRELLLEAVAIPGCGIFQAGTRQIREGNKRLAMIGDSVLDLVIKTEDYTAGKLRGESQYNAANYTHNVCQAICRTISARLAQTTISSAVASHLASTITSSTILALVVGSPHV